MRAYVAGRAGESRRAQAVAAALRMAGWDITCEWWKLPVTKPYKQSPGEPGRLANSRAARVMLEGVRDCDVLFVAWDDNLVGGFIELGAALAWDRWVIILDPRAEWERRDSIYELLPRARVYRTVADALLSAPWK